MSNQLGTVAVAVNQDAANFLKAVQFQRLVYAKWRGGKLVKAIYEGVA